MREPQASGFLTEGPSGATMTNAENTSQKQRPGFAPGKSGNPFGRPAGSRNKTTLLAERLMQDDAEAIVRAVIDAAKSGDMTAARMIVERIAPVRKGALVSFDMPPVETAGDLAAAMGAMVQAMAQGEVTPDEAATIASVFEIRRKTIETFEFEQRLKALEGRKDK
jgi:hypothetical protein